jgi:hypothetical protein
MISPLTLIRDGLVIILKNLLCPIMSLKILNV